MICLLIMETAMVGVFCALDFVLFFVFWEAMLIPMALLIGVWGGPRKIYAALKFFIYTMAGSVFLLVAIIALRCKVGSFSIPDMMGQRLLRTSFQFWIFLAFFISFAIKVPMFPFHTWLPAAHVEAPTAGSVLLASVLLKMGTYGFLRFSLPITPYATHFFTPYVLWLSVVAILYGGLTALAQTDLKKLVAYSSVAHMGFATLGIFALNKMGIAGRRAGDDQPRRHHRGAVHRRRASSTSACIRATWARRPAWARSCRSSPCSPGVFALSSLAFPGTNSFIGEFLVMSGGFKLATQNPAFIVAMICVVPGVVLAAAYMLRMLQKVAYGGTQQPRPFRPEGPGVARDPHADAAAGLCLLDRPSSRAVHPRAWRRACKHLLDQTQQPSATAMPGQPQRDTGPRNRWRDSR